MKVLGWLLAMSILAIIGYSLISNFEIEWARMETTREQARAMTAAMQAQTEMIKSQAAFTQAQTATLYMQSFLLLAALLAIFLLVVVAVVLAIFAVQQAGRPVVPAYLPPQESRYQLKQGQTVIVWPDQQIEVLENQRSRYVHS